MFTFLSFPIVGCTPRLSSESLLSSSTIVCIECSWVGVSFNTVEIDLVEIEHGLLDVKDNRDCALCSDWIELASEGISFFLANSSFL